MEIQLVLSKPLISYSNHMVNLLGVIQTTDWGSNHTVDPAGVIQTIFMCLKLCNKVSQTILTKILYHSVRQLTYIFRRAPHVLLWTPYTLDL